jgi:2-dehydro-3-deoxyglucarate aldolase
MSTHNFREALARGTPLVGPVVTLPCPGVVEILAEVGYDWFFIDGEHGPMDIGHIVGLLQAAQGRCPCLVRVPSSEDVFIKRALDAGADGIIVPLVNSAETARRVVDSAKYPPEGKRSVGGGRAHTYGFTFDRYLATANARVAVVLQVEHVQAARNIESILDVAGIDAIFVGPYDMSASLGKPGRIDDPEVQAHIFAVRDACRRRGMPLGIFVAAAEAAPPFIRQGFTLLAVGADAGLLGEAARRSLTAAKGPGGA